MSVGDADGDGVVVLAVPRAAERGAWARSRRFCWGRELVWATLQQRLGLASAGADLFLPVTFCHSREESLKTLVGFDPAL